MRSKNYLFMISIVSACFLYGCRNERGLQPNLEINNEDLRSAIVEYDSLLRTSILECDSSLKRLVSTNNYLLTVFEDPLNDSVTQFSISVSLDTWNLQNAQCCLQGLITEMCFSICQIMVVAWSLQMGNSTKRLLESIFPRNTSY